MEDGVNSFPLFDLPNAPLRCVLKNMELLHQVGFSILSEKSKKLIKSLKLEVSKVSVSIHSFADIEVLSQNHFYVYLDFCTEQLAKNEVRGIRQFLTEMYKPDFVRTKNIEDGKWKTYKWKKQGYEIKDWIDHLLSIFNRPKLDRLSFLGSTPFNLNSLRKTISDVNEIQIDDANPVPYIKQVIQTYPSAKKLFLCFDSEHDLDEFHSINCQNFDVLTLSSTNPDVVQKWKLDDLLIMNSRNFALYSPSLIEKDFNAFLKHWQNGSNSRMKYMKITFRGNINPNKEVIFRGLNYQIVPTDQERLLKRPV